jgi:hypothetical protein
MKTENKQEKINLMETENKPAELIAIEEQFKNEVKNHIKNKIDDYDLKIEYVKDANNKMSTKIEFILEAELCELSVEKISPDVLNYITILNITYK